MSRDWIEENYKDGLLKFGLRRARRLFEGRSDFQKVEVSESEFHGRVLMNDDCFMLSERDERIYHEMMAHVPLLAHPNPERVLIIGGGDGGTAREVLRHSCVRQCVMVEIDRMVVEACREFIPQTAAVFDSPRLDLRIDDGVAYMRDSRETFDVILIDSTDPNGAAQPLFGEEFYDNVVARLAPNGCVVAQGESVFYEASMQENLLRIAADRFACSAMFNFSNMTYPGGLWSFLWGSQGGVHPLKGMRRTDLEMFYYNQDVHRASFCLPEFQRQRLAQWTKI